MTFNFVKSATNKSVTYKRRVLFFSSTLQVEAIFCYLFLHSSFSQLDQGTQAALFSHSMICAVRS
jgi:hypothetical protein